jgi:hypothetical protein
VGPPELFLFRAQAVRLEGPRHALIIVVRDCATLFGTAGLIIEEESGPGKYRDNLKESENYKQAQLVGAEPNVLARLGLTAPLALHRPFPRTASGSP